MALEVTSVLTVGNQVIAEWTSRATARGGAAYHNRNIGIFTVRDGKIAAVREYTDTQHAAHVLLGRPDACPARPDASSPRPDACPARPDACPARPDAATRSDPERVAGDASVTGVRFAS